MALLNTADKIYLGSQLVDKVYYGSNLVYPSSLLLPETQAILARADLEGFTKPSALVITAMDNHIRAKKADGSWDKIDKYNQFAYNDVTCLNFSRIDWKRPTAALCIIYGGMTYTASGWKGNKIDAWIDPVFKPSTDGVNYTLNDAGKTNVIYESRTGGSFVGSSNEYSQICADNANVLKSINGDKSGSMNSLADTTGLGMKSMYRYNSTNISLYNRGNAVQDRTQNSDPASMTYDYWLFNAGASGNKGDAGQSLFELSASCNTTEQTAKRALYNQYLSDIGLTQFA